MSQLVSKHCGYNTSCTAIFSKTIHLWVRIRVYTHIRTIVVSTCGKLTEFYFLHLLSIIYYSVTTNIRSGKKVSYLSLGDVNLRDGLGTPFNKPRLYVLNSRLHGVL
jgi:hypothetical protein